MKNALSMTQLKEKFTYPNNIKLFGSKWYVQFRPEQNQDLNFMTSVHNELRQYGWGLLPVLKGQQLSFISEPRLIMVCSIAQLKEEFSCPKAIGLPLDAGCSEYQFKLNIPEEKRTNLEEFLYELNTELEELGWMLKVTNLNFEQIDGVISSFTNRPVVFTPVAKPTEATIMELLSAYIRTMDVSVEDTPIGVVFSASGRPCLKYSLSTMRIFNEVSEAFDRIALFLKEKGYLKD